MYTYFQNSINHFFSNGFLNPAVTLAVLLGGALNPITSVCYVLMQLLGAVSGAAIASVSYFCDVQLVGCNDHELSGDFAMGNTCYT